MEGKKIDRLDLDWEIEIFVEGFFGIFLGWDLDWEVFRWWGEKFFFSTKN